MNQMSVRRGFRALCVLSRLITRYLVAVVLLFASSAIAREYRVDSQKKFDAISQIEMIPGDAILLKRGMQFSGMLSPKGNGAEGNPVRIGTYGRGQRPKIHAKGKHQAGLMLKNKSFWEVQGLEITNTNGTDKDQGDLFKGEKSRALETRWLYKFSKSSIYHPRKPVGVASTYLQCSWFLAWLAVVCSEILRRLISWLKRKFPACLMFVSLTWTTSRR